MIDKVLLVLCILGFMACKQAEPANYDREFIKGVLIDLHIADAAVTRFMSKDRDSVRTIFYDEVYQIHHTTEADFDSMMSLLQKEPIQYRDLYTEVKDSLDNMKKN